MALKDVAAWASAMDLAEITGPGLFGRLRGDETRALSGGRSNRSSMN